ncbi:MAG: type VI secretion protein IcmF/TssM N-terminal domain-containing protein [Planctomycetales bacterium]
MAKKPDPMKSLKKFRGLAKAPTGMAAIRFYLTLPFSKAGQITKDFFAGRLSPWMHRVVEFLVLVAVFLLLTYLNRKLGLERFLGGVPVLRRYWLGLIVLLIWFVARLSFMFLRQLPRRSGRFDDIQIGFQVISEAANRVGVNLSEVPLFLVLGTTPISERALCRSPLVGDDLKVDDDDLPVHCFGGRSAVWLTLPGVSAITAQELFAQGVSDLSASSAMIRLPNQEKQETFRRMEFAMRCLTRLRRGVVPVNGVIALVPYEWLADPRYSQLVDTIKVDMVAVQQQLPVHCHSAVVFHKIETSTDFCAYIERDSADSQQRRCGCSAPELSTYSPQDADPLHQWLYRLFQRTTYRVFASEPESTVSNGKLVNFLIAVKSFREQFGRVLINAWPDELESRFYFGGVYFAELSENRSVFIDGLLVRFLKTHDHVVGWSERAIKHDRWLRAVAVVAAVASIVLLVSDVFLISRLVVWAAH